MKKVLLILSIATCICACNRSLNIKHTNWIGVRNNSNISISFKDSICEFYELFETGYIDTVRAFYSINNDTILFTPIDEYVTFTSKLVMLGNELRDTKTGVTTFKLKEK